MFRSIAEMIGYSLTINRETVGKCKDLLFDDDCWTIRYLLADTGGWLLGKKVLVSPYMVEKIDWSTKAVYLNISKDQLENCPSQNADEPVSREHEAKLYQFFGHPAYWSHDGLWGPASYPTDVSVAMSAEIEINPIDVTEKETDEENHLRSFKEIKGYAIDAENGDIGHIEDMIVDDQTWALRYIVVDTRNWLPGGKKVLLSLGWVDAVNWFDSKLSVNLSKEKIEKSPEFNPGKPINTKYEKQLYDYYGRPNDGQISKELQQQIGKMRTN